MNGKELCRELEEIGAQVTSRTLAAWRKRGMPAERGGRGYDYDAVAVRDWLVAEGIVEHRRVLTSRDDVARHFGVSLRTIAYWLGKGCPGQQGHYDLDDIEAWREREDARTTGRTSNTEADRGRKLDNDLKELRLRKMRGELVAVEPVRRLFTSQIHTAKSHLDQLTDQVLAVLPDDTPTETLKEARLRIQRAIDNTYVTLSDLLAAEELSGQEVEENE